MVNTRLIYLAPLGFIVGVVMLAVGAARQGAVPTWAAALLALAVLMVGTETAIVSNALPFIAGATVLLAGGVAVALPILRMSDEQFYLAAVDERGCVGHGPGGPQARAIPVHNAIAKIDVLDNRSRRRRARTGGTCGRHPWSTGSAPGHGPPDRR